MAFDDLARRFRASAFTFAGVAATFATFLFPTTRIDDPYRTCYGGTEYISFRPLWNLDGLPSDGLGICVEAALALSFGVGVWFLYPAFHPPPAVIQRRP